MANNRLYIRCKNCGGTAYIGSHWGGKLQVTENIYENLTRFFGEHCYCGHSVYNVELCEEFPGEMTDNNIDSDGKVCWW